MKFIKESERLFIMKFLSSFLILFFVQNAYPSKVGIEVEFHFEDKPNKVFRWEPLVKYLKIRANELFQSLKFKYSGIGISKNSAVLPAPNLSDKIILSFSEKKIGQRKKFSFEVVITKGLVRSNLINLEQFLNSKKDLMREIKKSYLKKGLSTQDFFLKVFEELTEYKPQGAFEEKISDHLKKIDLGSKNIIFKYEDYKKNGHPKVSISNGLEFEIFPESSMGDYRPVWDLAELVTPPLSFKDIQSTEFLFKILKAQTSQNKSSIIHSSPEAGIHFHVEVFSLEIFQAIVWRKPKMILGQNEREKINRIQSELLKLRSVLEGLLVKDNSGVSFHRSLVNNFSSRMRQEKVAALCSDDIFKSALTLVDAEIVKINSSSSLSVVFDNLSSFLTQKLFNLIPDKYYNKSIANRINEYGTFEFRALDSKTLETPKVPFEVFKILLILGDPLRKLEPRHVNFLNQFSLYSRSKNCLDPLSSWE